MRGLYEMPIEGTGIQQVRFGFSEAHPIYIYLSSLPRFLNKDRNKI